MRKFASSRQSGKLLEAGMVFGYSNGDGFPKTTRAGLSQLSLDHLRAAVFFHNRQLHGPAGHQLPEGIFLHAR
jgi:hypothetical protein